MNQRIYSLFFVLMFMLFGNTALASEHANGGEKAFNPSELINHHIYDAHEWHVATLSEGEEEEFHVTIPLPVIVKDAKGWHFFMSSSVAHGEVIDGYTSRFVQRNWEGVLRSFCHKECFCVVHFCFDYFRIVHFDGEFL